MKNILVLLPYDEKSKKKLVSAVKDKCNIAFINRKENREEYLSALKKANLIIGEVPNGDFEHCENLEMLQSSSSGINYYIDGGKFPEKAKLCCMTGCYGNVIAEHLLALLLSLCRRLPEYRDQQNRQKWEIVKYDKPLEGSTLLIIGAGDIGTTLAGWMRPMVKKIIGVRRTVRDFPDCYDEMVTLDRLDDVLPEADFTVCVLPHTPETAGLLDKRRLRLMKDDSVLINGGRGSLIDQSALLEVMAEGKFFGVGLDVTVPEPLPLEHPLWKQPRLIITPHSAGNSAEVTSPLEQKIREFILKNTLLWLEGKEPENVIDFSVGYRKNY
ncbi:MAG: D-2-hydroxyacid dehydrogenase [Oscillospiraceae bacterium]|nr:D-2-hydroxyacid dehydrogenase [Oscillospiraceae bacterium]